MNARMLGRVAGWLALGGWGCFGSSDADLEGERSAQTRAAELTVAAEREAAQAVDGGVSAGVQSLGWVTEARAVRTTDEQRHLLLELIVQNGSDAPRRLAALDLFEVGRRRPLASFGAAELAEMVIGGEPLTGALEPGAPAFVLLDVTLAPGQRLPRSLRAELRTDAGEVSSSSELAVVRDRPIRLSPPLRGDNLVDVNGCCRGGHREALLADVAEIFVAQRYAIDFVRLQGLSTFEGAPSDNESYFIFGDDVLAAASGRVVESRDGIAENDPTQPLPPFAVETAAGNYVLQELGPGHFALYAHLQLGSVRVQPGDRVRRGQTLGLVGNTGNSTEPHLHFHVVDRPSPLFADGLPYVFDQFQLQGRVDLSVPALLPTEGPLDRRNRLPMNLDIVAFE